MDNTEFNCKCPVCNSYECKMETTEDGIESRVCDNCGYMTVNKYKIDSIDAAEFEKTTAQIVIDFKYIDEDLNQYWYPSTIYIPDKGAIFPIGNKADKEFKYAFAMVVPVPIHLRLQYPIPNKPGEYYEQRLAVEQLITCESFNEAINKLTAIL